MNIGIGLPTTIPDVDGATVVEWAQKAEAAGFSTLATIDRLIYQNYDCLTPLAAAAAVTQRIRLTTCILIAPLFANTLILAKQAASIDRLSNGRLVLGVGIGGRNDDFELSGLNTEHRGRVLNRQIDELKRVWSEEQQGVAGAIGPKAVRPGGPELLVGARTPPGIRRAARTADGIIAGNVGGVPFFRQTLEALRREWSAAGRPGKPRMVGISYFALGPNAAENARINLNRYYGFTGGQVVESLVAGALTDAAKVKATIAEYEAAESDELILFPCTGEMNQLDQLAAVVFG